MSAGTSDAEACGDKFLRVGRGARYQRAYVAVHPASLLLVARPGSTVAAALKDLEPTLKRAGHKSVVVKDASAVADALDRGQFNIVLADLKDVPTVEGATRTNGARVDVFPFIEQPTSAARAAVEGDFHCVAEVPGKKKRGARQDRRADGARPQGNGRDQPEAVRDASPRRAGGGRPSLGASGLSSLRPPILCPGLAAHQGRGRHRPDLRRLRLRRPFRRYGQRIPYGGTRAFSAAGDVTYGVTDRLRGGGQPALHLEQVHRHLPRVSCSAPSTSTAAITATSRTSAFEARYMALAGDLPSLPSWALNLPSHGYEVVGEAVPGKRTKEALPRPGQRAARSSPSSRGRTSRRATSSASWRTWCRTWTARPEQPRPRSWATRSLYA